MTWKPTKESSKLLLESQRLINEYSGSITLRQLYYLLATKGSVDFDETAYRKVKNLMINARKSKRVPPTTFAADVNLPDEEMFGSVEKYLDNCVKQYRIPRTFDQPNYIEIWVEREPLKVFMDSLVSEYDIPVFVTGGYSSLSFVFEAAQRIELSAERKGSPRILYFSDFSPASTNMFESQVSEISAHLSLTREEAAAIMLKVCVEPEHIVKFDLPILDTLPSTSKTTLFEEQYSDTLEALGLPRIPLVEIESLNPFDLADIVSNVLFSLTDQTTLGEIAILEDKNKREITRRLLEINE